MAGQASQSVNVVRSLAALKIALVTLQLPQAYTASTSMWQHEHHRGVSLLALVSAQLASKAVKPSGNFGQLPETRSFSIIPL